MGYITSHHCSNFPDTLIVLQAHLLLTVEVAVLAVAVKMVYRNLSLPIRSSCAQAAGAVCRLELSLL